jgi:hypothetical protein
VNKKHLLSPGAAVLLLLAAPIGCGTQHSFTADNSYDQPPPRAPVGDDATAVFSRSPWTLRRTSSGQVRYLDEARLVLPDAAKAFVLNEIFVYTADGSDVQLLYVSDPPGAVQKSRATVRISIWRSSADLDTEWKRFERRWQERQAGARAQPLPLPSNYPAETKRMAWTVPVGDGYGGPAFEEIILFHDGGWYVRYGITCSMNALPEASNSIVSFLRGLHAPADQVGLLGQDEAATSVARDVQEVIVR